MPFKVLAGNFPSVCLFGTEWLWDQVIQTLPSTQYSTYVTFTCCVFLVVGSKEIALLMSYRSHKAGLNENSLTYVSTEIPTVLRVNTNLKRQVLPSPTPFPTAMRADSYPQSLSTQLPSTLQNQKITVK